MSMQKEILSSKFQNQIKGIKEGLATLRILNVQKEIFFKNILKNLRVDRPFLVPFL